MYHFIRQIYKALYSKGVYPLKQIVTTISMIIKSSYKLDRKQDVIKYTKELLKAYIQRFNNNEIEKVELLGMYSTFIELQIVNKDFSGAKKAIKHLKLFNLNSDDVKDVKIAMEKDGYKKALPLYKRYVYGVRIPQKVIPTFVNVYLMRILQKYKRN